jgi:hypothetical protein
LKAGIIREWNRIKNIIYVQGVAKEYLTRPEYARMKVAPTTAMIFMNAIVLTTNTAISCKIRKKVKINFNN